MSGSFTRRGFLAAVSVGSVTLGKSFGAASPTIVRSALDERPALLGGSPVRSGPFPSWPVSDSSEERALKAVLRSGRWNRSDHVGRFEREWARLMEVPHVLATSSGTSALYCSLAALEVGPGDEVLVPAYTFAATVNVVILRHALPVFVDTDRETLQMDAGKLESKWTSRTRAVIPVHLGGAAADMDAILQTTRRRSVAVVEDACQAHLGEWRGRKLGTLGDLGCYSFQASKNLNSGEGGAVATGNSELARVCAGFHSVGRPFRLTEEGSLVVDRASSGFPYERVGDNRRLTEFQAAILLSQLERLEAQARKREENAAYLDSLLSEFPGFGPARSYSGCTRNAYHLYLFRYDSDAFAGMSKSRFLQALRAEGIPCSPGYRPLNLESFIQALPETRAYRRIYDRRILRAWRDRNHCPETERLSGDEAGWFSQAMLLGERSDMEAIAAAVGKIRRNAEALREA